METLTVFVCLVDETEGYANIGKAEPAYQGHLFSKGHCQELLNPVLDLYLI
jgi:hypothetical protein